MKIALIADQIEFTDYSKTEIGNIISVFSCGINENSIEKIDRSSGWYDWFCSYIISGKSKYIINGIEYEARPYDFILIPPDTPYSSTSNESVYRYWVHFNSPKSSNIIKQLNFNEYICNIGEHSSIINAFKNVIKEFNSFKPMNNEVCSSYILTLLSLASRHNKNNHIIINSSEASILAAIHYINNHFTGDISVNELADISGYAVSHFTRLFKNKTKMSPNRYINWVRIERSKEIISQGNYKINEIAKMVGFYDAYYFSRVFRKIEGVSPMNYKHKSKEQ